MTDDHRPAFAPLFTAFILVMAFAVPLIIFQGTMDDFAPSVVPSVNEILQYGHLPDSTPVNQVPGYHIFGTFIVLLVNIPVEDLPVFPVQVIPLLLLIFAVYYRISGSLLLAGLVTLIEMISGTNGSERIFFWPHGMGYILFLLLVLLILLILEEKGFRSRKYLFLASIAGTTLILISYDYAAMALMLLFMLYAIQRVLPSDESVVQSRKQWVLLLSVLVVVQFGISQFFYVYFIPNLKIGNPWEISVIDKFFMLFFQAESVQTPLQGLYMTFPVILTRLAMLKYSLLVISIFVLIFFVLKKWRGRVSLDPFDTFTLAILLMAAVYAGLRTGMGALSITDVYLPGLFATIWIYRRGGVGRRYAIGLIAVLLVFAPLYLGGILHYQMRNQDSSLFHELDSPAQWLYLHGDRNNWAFSDVMTMNRMNGAIAVRNNLTYDEVSQTIQVLQSAHVVSLLGKSPRYYPRSYFILNFRLNSMSLEQYRILKSWRFIEDTIESGRNSAKIYASGAVSVFVASDPSMVPEPQPD